MTILPMRIDISLSESTQEYSLQVEQNQYDFSVDAAESITVNIGEVYDGPYEVIPKVFSQTLRTKEKRMEDDVAIREIPYYETTNYKNGITVIIADRLDD